MSSFENTRYNRQINMPEWGADKQEQLKNARVAVIGAGGVKTTLLTALVASGIGHLRIIEFDEVELSNLNRQTLYSTKDVGKPKGLVATNNLMALNPDTQIEWVNERINENNIDELLEGCEFIVEGGDSPHGRNLVNEYCLSAGKPYVHASAQYNYGYCFSVVPTKKTACFACFFPTDYTRKESTGPVPVSVLSAQIAGSLGAVEVLKWFLGYKNNMTVNKRLCFSSLLLSENFKYLKQNRRKNCPVCLKYYQLD